MHSQTTSGAAAFWYLLDQRPIRAVLWVNSEYSLDNVWLLPMFKRTDSSGDFADVESYKYLSSSSHRTA